MTFHSFCQIDRMIVILEAFLRSFHANLCGGCCMLLPMPCSMVLSWSLWRISTNLYMSTCKSLSLLNWCGGWVPLVMEGRTKVISPRTMWIGCIWILFFSTHLNSKHDAGTLSQDEWEVSYLYLAFVLRKVLQDLVSYILLKAEPHPIQFGNETFSFCSEGNRQPSVEPAMQTEGKCSLMRVTSSISRHKQKCTFRAY